MKRYLLQMPLELWDKLKAKSKEDDLTVSQLIRKILKRSLK